MEPLATTLPDGVEWNPLQTDSTLNFLDLDSLKTDEESPSFTEQESPNSSSSSEDGKCKMSTGTKSGMPRTVFSRKQLTRLEERFIQQTFLSKEERLQLAKELALTERQIMVWFQNRRGRLKRRGPADSAFCPEKLRELNSKRPYPFLSGLLTSSQFRYPHPHPYSSMMGNGNHGNTQPSNQHAAPQTQQSNMTNGTMQMYHNVNHTPVAVNHNQAAVNHGSMTYQSVQHYSSRPINPYRPMEMPKSHYPSITNATTAPPNMSVYPTMKPAYSMIQHTHTNQHSHMKQGYPVPSSNKSPVASKTTHIPVGDYKAVSNSNKISPNITVGPHSGHVPNGGSMPGKSVTMTQTINNYNNYNQVNNVCVNMQAADISRVMCSPPGSQNNSSGSDGRQVVIKSPHSASTNSSPDGAAAHAWYPHQSPPDVTSSLRYSSPDASTSPLYSTPGVSTSPPYPTPGFSTSPQYEQISPPSTHQLQSPCIKTKPLHHLSTSSGSTSCLYQGRVGMTTNTERLVPSNVTVNFNNYGNSHIELDTPFDLPIGFDIPEISSSLQPNQSQYVQQQGCVNFA